MEKTCLRMCPSGILTVASDDKDIASIVHFEPTAVSIILEGCIVMNDVDSLPKAFALVFGLIYALHLDYPNGMKSTF